MNLFNFIKRAIIAVFFLFTSTAVFAQGNKAVMPVNISIQFLNKSENADFILYNVNNELAIEDFKGKPDMSSEGVGATFSGIQMSFDGQSSNGIMNIKVYLMTYFDRSKSWMKPEGKDERVLKHEQIHFDLTAIYACKMYQEISKGTFDSKNVKQKLHEIHDRLTAALQLQQEAYDKETKHGTIAEAQKAWSEKVAKEKASFTCM